MNAKKKRYIRFAKQAVKESDTTAAESADAVPSEDDLVLTDQLDDLRSELKSSLPEPEEFLSFEKAKASEEGDEETDPASTAGRFPNAPRWLIRFGIITSIIAALVVVALFLFFSVEVPDLRGYTAVEASEQLTLLGLNFEIFEEEAPGIPAGQVISTTPAAGEQTFRGARVVMRVSAASSRVSVPNLDGMNFEQAQTALANLRLTAEEVRTFDSTVPRGRVVGFLPTSGTQVAAGSVVKILISAGTTDAQVEVPSVLGLSEGTARQALADAGFNPVFYQAAASFGQQGEVVAQTPGGRNLVSPGSVVLLMVSTGNSTTDLSVPDITNQSMTAATTIISQAGFVPEYFSMIDSTVATGTVISQMPPAENTLLRAGGRLGFLVSSGDVTTVEVPSVLALDATAAIEAISQRGFIPVLVSAPELANPELAGGSGIITQQFPAGGSRYHLGLPVLMYVSTQN
ncbi:MAG: PASTA domain-containing protein [Coriobacteriia bacterium]|nr:PASTA domain-containing protein [Coriobacteriia bacterium]